VENRRVRLGRCELMIVEERGSVYIFQRVFAVDGGETGEDWLVAEEEFLAPETQLGSV